MGDCADELSTEAIVATYSDANKLHVSCNVW
jgi:hypothetical protein